ncbi:PIN domain-containing protein [Goodfellowiella coeruleoviolacea]|uniref:PIN domain-containing protein n=1 Tax=Goodfellowiella coeruleoviolacea TaxID=334858 RepID=A0AAE3KJP6_9PSEU|nr:hypothetical protein [Goodfellowiella coeruleoviolacea]MCP2164543.1 hypothetical protein [Goodfellowiella coeruleoviolacea]
MNEVRYVLVDTDVVSYLMKNGPQAEHFRPHLIGRIPTVSFVTVAELHHGAYNGGWGERKMACQTWRSPTTPPTTEQHARGTADTTNAGPVEVTDPAFAGSWR